LEHKRNIGVDSFMKFLPSPSAAASAPSLPAGFRRGFAGSAHAARWRPGLVAECRHGEIFAQSGEASGAGLALALALDAMRSAAPDPAADTPDERAWLWVQDKAALRLSGRPYRPGLPAALRHRLVHVAAMTPEDALFGLEEGLRCRDFAFVIGEIAGNPRALDFTASRRLSLAAERHGVPLWLVRLDARRDLGSARMRWEARAAPSPPPRWNPQSPGTPSWAAGLFRAHTHQPGQWILRDDGLALLAEPASAPATPDHGDLVRAAGDRSLAAG
jgi:protein ImuA